LLGLVSFGVAESGVTTEATAAVAKLPVAVDGQADASVAETSKPPEQRAFVRAVAAGRIGYLGSTNELEQHLIEVRRDKQVCAAVPGPAAGGWVGRISHLGAGSGGRGELEVQIGYRAKVSNSGEQLIPEGAMYKTLARKGEGDVITFTGSFLRDDQCPSLQSMWPDHRQMTDPTYSFQFTDVK
jgi:hypothetical protein